MRIGFYSTVIGSQQQERKLDVIANNIANANTPGYKKDNVHFKNYMVEETTPLMTQGRIVNTGNDLDIALSGDGFMSVQAGKDNLYTRAGNLTVNSDKVLVTQQGYPVMGQNGGPIQVPDAGANLRIEPNGQVYDGDNLIDTLNIVKFTSDAEYEKAGSGYFKAASGAPKPLPATGVTVRQGALEDANFDLVGEMTNLIDSSRIFESYQKTLDTIQQQDSEITNKLGNP